MSNFLKFIDEDIEAKKTLIATMPTNTKTEIKKYNASLDTISKKYIDYKASVKKYIDSKNKSFSLKETSKDSEKLNNNLNNLEHVRFILNPTNTFLEKVGFDNLLYEISNYYDFNFTSLNDIIEQFLKKFELAGIKLNVNDFNYTCYVQDYMKSFLDVRNNKKGNYEGISKIFEQIYWVNPEIIGHIELNFRKLIRKYEKDFNNYIIKIQKEVMQKNNITNYKDCLEKLKVAYNELDVADRETIADIVNLAITNQIDINSYFEDSKIRTSTYTSLMIDPINLDDKELMGKFYESLEKLKVNIEEYDNYAKFLPLIDDFKKQYEKLISSDEKTNNKAPLNKDLKDVESKIKAKESKLESINKKIFSGKLNFFSSVDEKTLKKLRIDSVILAKELYELYKSYDQEYFKSKVLVILNKSLTIAELLHLYYSFDYFKKMAIKKVFSITLYDEIIKYSENFDLFAMNPNNVIIDGIHIFEENNIAKTIMNKYRLDNINLTEETLNPDDLKVILDKIDLLMRINVIENSTTTVEKIWFMSQVAKINKIENKAEVN